MTISMIYVCFSPHLSMFTILFTNLPLYSSNCHPPLPVTANAHSSLRSCKLWSLMIITDRATTITLLSDVLAQAVLHLSCWRRSCGEVEATWWPEAWGGGGHLIRGSFHTPFYLLCTTASNGLMQLSIQFIGASLATLSLAALWKAFEVYYSSLGNHKYPFCLLQGSLSCQGLPYLQHSKQGTESVLGNEIACPNTPDRHCIHKQWRAITYFSPLMTTTSVIQSPNV